jgi:Transposase DDE domain
VSVKLTNLASCIQLLFTDVAERLGRATGLIRRQRKLTASGFAQTLIFQWMAKPRATVDSMARHLNLSPQALHEHLGPKAQAFLRALLAETLKNAWKARPERLGLLDRFKAAIVEDTTTISLPAELASQFPGCGGREKNDGAAALKVLIRWDVRSGELCHLSVHAGRTSDKPLAATAADIPDGGLHLADQGFFNSERWNQFGSGKYWISRVPAGTLVCSQGVWQMLSMLLATVTGSIFDEHVKLVEKTRLPCRLVALRCPESVANSRRRKLREYTRSKKGREPSAEQLRMCDWTVFATNVPVEKLSAKEVWLVYRCRWQIELLFKRAKQQSGWGFSCGKSGQRFLIELYAKFIGLVVKHWLTLIRGGPLCGVSSKKLFEVVQDLASELGASLSEGQTMLDKVLTKLARQLASVRPQAKSRKRTNTRQTLINPGLAA